MPAFRKSAELLSLNGSFSEKPSRYRPSEPKCEKLIGDPPAYLSTDARKIWREFVSNAAPNSLSASDRVMMEIATRLTLKLRNGTIISTELSVLSSALSKLGWSPSDRNKISAVAQTDKTSDLDFLNK